MHRSSHILRLSNVESVILERLARVAKSVNGSVGTTCKHIVPLTSVHFDPPPASMPNKPWLPVEARDKSGAKSQPVMRANNRSEFLIISDATN